MPDIIPLLKRYALYIGRWQLSTPLLAIITAQLASKGTWIASIIANLIGALIFFWLDRVIFTSQALGPIWQVEENVTCVDCRILCRGYRLIRTKNYDKIQAKPEWRCEKCSIKKTTELQNRGVALK